MSPGENDCEKDLDEDLISTIVETETSQAENDHKKELEHLTLTIAERIDEGATKIESFFSSACIYRVSEDLRSLKESAYTPHLIAIGPLHREDEHLQTPLQHVKMSYTKYLLSRLTVGMEDLELAKQTNLMVLQKCLEEMKTSLGDAKKCYAAEVTVDEEMMLVDGCFILEYLYRSRSRSLKEDRAEEKGNKPIDGGDNGNSKEQETADPIFGNHGMTAYNIDFDLVLLENQIPFFVLEKLFQLTVAQIPNQNDKNWLLIDYVLGNYSFIMSPAEGSPKTTNSAKNWCLPGDCVLRILGNKLESPPTASEEEDQSSCIDHQNVKYYHILHAIHDACLPHEQTETKKPSHIDRELEVLMPSASNLAYAGVKFVPVTSDNLFKVQFTEPGSLFWWYHRARFEIPALEIYDATESSFRNLIAFEQHCPGVSQHVSCYAHLWNVLVNSNEDVQVLEKAGVLRNNLGAPDDATDLFNKLDKEILISGDYFADTYMKATRYSERFWPKNMAALSRTYFSSPWTFIAFCVGFVAFVMSSVEFVRGFLKKG